MIDGEPSAVLRRIVPALFCLLAVATTVHVWFNLFHIPLQRPALPLFPTDAPPVWRGPGPQPLAGWTPWYAPVTIAALFGWVISARLVRWPSRWSMLAMVVAGWAAILSGIWAAYWMEHGGYLWQRYPDATLREFLAMVRSTAFVSVGEACVAFARQWHLVLIGTVSAIICALVTQALFRSRNVSLPDLRQSDASALTPRIASALVLFVLSQLGDAHGQPSVMLMVGTCITTAWLFIAFVTVEFKIGRLLLGSLIASTAAAVIHSVIIFHNSTFVETFRNNPFTADMISIMTARTFVQLFVLYGIGLSLIFVVLAKMTISLARRLTPPEGGRH